MIFKSKIAQFSIIELPIAFLLFSSIIYLLANNNTNLPSSNLQLPTESTLLNLVESSNFQNLVLNEDLSSSTITGNWTYFNDTLTSQFLHFDLEIIKGNSNKKIFNCSSDLNKIIYSNFVYIYNNSEYDFREVRLGVCT